MNESTRDAPFFGSRVVRGKLPKKGDGTGRMRLDHAAFLHNVFMGQTTIFNRLSLLILPHNATLCN
jgi:hypothetical protein